MINSGVQRKERNTRYDCRSAFPFFSLVVFDRLYLAISTVSRIRILLIVFFFFNRFKTGSPFTNSTEFMSLKKMVFSLNFIISFGNHASFSSMANRLSIYLVFSRTRSFNGKKSNLPAFEIKIFIPNIPLNATLIFSKKEAFSSLSYLQISKFQ